MNINMHAMYDHFPDHHNGNPTIECYSDTHVTECKSPGRNIALLLEPKSMIGDAYAYVKAYNGYFKYIFTHDSELLRLPQARMLNWADVWCRTDSEKTKGISLMSSWKNWCPLHSARLQLANILDNNPKVDCYGSFRPGDKDKWVDARIAHEHYKFAVVVENDIDEFWYTEKLLNCLSNKVVPIYVGATKIGEIFNTDGMILVDDWRDIPSIVHNLDIDAEYEKRRDAIEDNFERSIPYDVNWKERFFRDYGGLLESI